MGVRALFRVVCFLCVLHLLAFAVLILFVCCPFGCSLFFPCFCFGSGLGALERFGDLWEAPGCSGRLWDALGRLCEAG